MPNRVIYLFMFVMFCKRVKLEMIKSVVNAESLQCTVKCGVSLCASPFSS